MMDLFSLATSYPPGHNFWPGSPFSWWVRGSIAFLMMTLPILTAGMLMLLMARRILTVWKWFLPLIVVIALAIFLNDFPARDGDKPWFHGVIWGQWVAARLAVVLGLLLLLAIAVPLGKDRRRGFEVLPAKRDSSSSP